MELDKMIVQAVTDLEEERTIRIVEKALRCGMSPWEIIICMQKGMDEVGRLYEEEKYFVGDLIMAGIIFREVMKFEEVCGVLPQEQSQGKGTLLIGTVKNDIHDIGKNIFSAMIQAEGFHVIDLGVDVDPEEFVSKVREHQPHILGLSGLMNFSNDEAVQVLRLLQKEGLRDNLKILLGGRLMHKKQETDAVYADAYVDSADLGVAICNEWAKEWN